MIRNHPHSLNSVGVELRSSLRVIYLNLKKVFTILFWCLVSMVCFSQTGEKDGEDRDIDFLFYLYEEKRYDEIVLLYEQISPKIRQNDSVSYILGMMYYYRQELDKSAYHLSLVSKSSVFYDKSVFFSAIDYAHLGDYSKSQLILENYSVTTQNNTYDGLISVKLAGLALLQRDFEMFDRYAKNFGFGQYYYFDSQNQLINVRKTLESNRGKSPFVAGALSAVVPGAGKMYTGQIGEGVATFLTVGSFVAIVAENWIKAGITNYKTIIFGTIGTIFYIGNIYGSIASVKVYKNQFNDQQNNTILLCIHLPVRALFR